MSEPHLTASELAAWRDQGLGDRDRIVGHLATCGTCRHQAAELERERPPDSDARPERLRPQAFVAIGRRMGMPSTRVRTVPRSLVYLAAAASLVLAAIVVPYWWQGTSGSVQRGSGAVVVLVQPVDATIALDTLTFEWTARADAGPLRLYVAAIDDPGTLLIERDVTGTRYEPTSEEKRRLGTAREYHWFVEYRGAGAGAGTSAAARFRLR